MLDKGYSDENGSDLICAWSGNSHLKIVSTKIEKHKL